MTREEIIESADKARPNLESYEDKLLWVNVLENQIFEHMTQFSESDAEISDTELLLGSEYKDMYVYYVLSMIDLANQDIAMYNNSCAFFNEMFESWQKKWRRGHLPGKRAERG